MTRLSCVGAAGTRSTINKALPAAVFAAHLYSRRVDSVRITVGRLGVGRATLPLSAACPLSSVLSSLSPVLCPPSSAPVLCPLPAVLPPVAPSFRLSSMSAMPRTPSLAPCISLRLLDFLHILVLPLESLAFRSVPCLFSWSFLVCVSRRIT